MTNIETEDLQALVQRIINSGVLGRSQTYAAILQYLCECSVEGRAPKEIAIAIDVLGRGADFDVAKDSIVRVHLYHLRTKLKTYYEKYGQNEKHRLDIPKGQYILTTEPNNKKNNDKPENGQENKSHWLMPRPAWLLLAVALLGMNVYQYMSSSASEELADQVNPYSGLGPWKSILDDQAPIMIVLGDYYIFGELDDGGNVARMVREFNINSEQDLIVEKNLRDEYANYFNLDLSYIPTSSAFALASIVPVLGRDNQRVKVKMMSELSTADLVNNHIVYIGYLSGLGSLHDLMFAASDLAIGLTYDELFNLETEEYYSSSSGLSIGENSFKDYGMLVTFPSPNGHQFVMIAGMRDEGLINISQEVSNLEELVALEANLGIDSESQEDRVYEALYEVVGFDSTNFDADLVYSKILDTDIIWEARLISNQER